MGASVHMIVALGEPPPCLLLERFVFHLIISIRFLVPTPIGRVTVSNVTSSGFHVAWVADLALHPTFQLTLTSTRSPTKHLETRNASLTLWGLEPGVLHLVEIVSKACGQESARAHLKVRTGKGFPKHLLPCVLKGRGKYERFLRGLRLKRAGLIVGCRVSIVSSAQRCLAHFMLSWHGAAEQEGAHFRVRCWATVGKELRTPPAHPCPGGFGQDGACGVGLWRPVRSFCSLTLTGPGFGFQEGQ